MNSPINPATRLMIAKLVEIAATGKSYAETAAELGVSYNYVASYARRFGINFNFEKRGPKGGPRAQASNREIAMRDLYVGGKTLLEIGAEFGISRERVRQLLTKYFGIRAKDGGKSKRVRDGRADFYKKRDARHLRKWGCTFKTYRALLDHPDKPTIAYSRQRVNASLRGIPWELTLWQWWSAWDKSGKWSERGRGRGYCMCRLNDTGPYAVDNVYIATGVENMQDYWANKRASAALGAVQ